MCICVQALLLWDVCVCVCVCKLCCFLLVISVLPDHSMVYRIQSMLKSTGLDGSMSEWGMNIYT